MAAAAHFNVSLCVLAAGWAAGVRSSFALDRQVLVRSIESRHCFLCDKH